MDDLANANMLHLWVRGCLAESQRVLAVIENASNICGKSAADCHLTQLRSHALSIVDSLTDIEGLAYELRANAMDQGGTGTCPDLTGSDQLGAEGDPI